MENAKIQYDLTEKSSSLYLRILVSLLFQISKIENYFTESFVLKCLKMYRFDRVFSFRHQYHSLNIK